MPSASYEDYPTSAEMIDYAYGRLNIHAYTIEVYSGGMSDPESPYVEDQCRWNNVLPDTIWDDYSLAEFIAMIDAKNGNGDEVAADLGLTDGDVIWFFH